MVEKVKFHLGRRGAVLLLFSLLYMIIGLGYLYASTEQAAMALRAATQITSGELEPWGVVWIACSLIGFITAFWPPGKDNWGFSSLAGHAYLWSSFYFTSWVLYGDEPRGWIQGCLFLAFGAALTLIAGWPEPRVERDRRPVR